MILLIFKIFNLVIKKFQKVFNVILLSDFINTISVNLDKKITFNTLLTIIVKTIIIKTY